MKSVSIDQISALDPAVVSLKQKKSSLQLTEVVPAERASAASLVFASTKALAETAIQRGAQALILSEKIAHDFAATPHDQITYWTTPNIPQAMSLVLPLFDRILPLHQGGVHPTAYIHPLAQVSASAHIGAYSVVEAHARVGANTIILPHVYIGPYCEIGERCKIASHVSIGSDGFGFFTDKKFQHHKIPQIGKVIIEDDCELGAHCAVDRATLTETRIRRGSKFDNFCHVAHNVDIGENALLAGGFMISGSTAVGKNLMAAGGVHVTGHIRIADNVVLTGRAGVTNNIEEPGMYGGFPLESHRESLRTLASLPQVKKIRRQITKILDHLNLTPED